MNSGPAGGPGQPPAVHQPNSSSSSSSSSATASGSSSSTSSSSRDQQQQHVQGSDPSGLQNITVMNITVPPVVPVPPSLRFVQPPHSYHLGPPPPPPSGVSSQQQHGGPAGQSVLSQVPSYGSSSANSASAVSVSSSSITRQHPASSNSSSSTYNTKDVYRNASSNVNERVSISVSNTGSIPSQVEYGRGGERPRISLLPAASASASASAPADYHALAAAAARNNRTGGSAIMLQPQDYRPDMAQLSHQDAPPFKKIRLTSGQQQQAPTPTNALHQSSQDCTRITTGQDSIKQKHVQLPPLKIDTRPPAGAYVPQTEAISPTLPEPNTQEDAAFKSTKEDLLSQISKLDREITQRESTISKLRKKLIELEEVASQPSDANRQTEEASQQPKHQSLAQKIYADNRKKAEEAHRIMEKLGLKVKLPLYNQPSDTTVYQENRSRHLNMKSRLVSRLRKEHANRAAIRLEASRTYARLVQEWHRKVEKLESTQKRKTKDAKNREFFEKVFPELRKQREDKERFNRVGARIKSEADLEEIMDGLQEQEEELSAELKNALKELQMEDKKMRSYAVIPPLLLDTRQRKIAYQNRNGLLQPEELETLHSERKLINVWSTTEHELFKEKYLQHPKNFGAISASFDHKSASDCVHHYYLTKKAENYKQLLRKSRRTRSSRNNPNNKVNNSNSTLGPIDILTTGVTTRLQREQQQKTQENPHSSSSAAAAAAAAASSSSSSSSNATTSTSAITSSSTSVTSTNSSGSTTTQSSTSAVASAGGASLSSESSTTTATTTTVTSTVAASASASVPSTSAATTTSSVLTTTSSSSASAKDAREANKENKEIKQEPKDPILHIKDIKEESQSGSETVSSRDIKIEGKGALSSSSNTSVVNANLQVDQQKDKKKNAGVTGATGRPKDKKKENHATPMETSDEESQAMDSMELSGRQLGPHPCAVCQTMVEAGNQSRPLSRSQASQYGLREDQVGLGARVCNNCRCKSVRGRLTTCPLPGCPNLSSSGGVNAKQRVKRLRALPAKWNDLPPEIRDPIIQEFQIPSNTTKCCSACFNRISRRLAPHFSGSGADGADDVDAIARQWTEEELDKLRSALREHGTNWSKVSELVPGKTNHQCKNYYLAYRKKLGLDQVVAEYYQSLGEERRPCLTDEEESGSSTSSCDEMGVHDSSDTASAGSPVTGTPQYTQETPKQPSSVDKHGGGSVDVAAVVPAAALSQNTTNSTNSSSQTPQTNPPTSTREDYDSSATETADEGQGSAELENTGTGGVVVTLTTPSGNASGNPAQPSQTLIHSQQQQSSVPSPPSSAMGNNPLTVKDLMLGVIEMSLKRNQNSPGTNSSVPVSSGTPTISSILKTDHRNDITFVREYKPSSQQQQQQSQAPNTAMPNRDQNLATLSVVSSHHGHRSSSSPQQMGQMQATITPCPPSTASQQSQQQASQEHIPKEGLVVMQQQQQQAMQRDTEGSRPQHQEAPHDLSIKKPRQEYNHALQPPPSHKASSMPNYRSSEPPPSATYYPSHAHPEQSRSSKSPHVYAPSNRPQAPLTPKVSKITVPPASHPKLSPKLSNMGSAHKTGSITHGTPVSAARYDVMRQTPPGSGSHPNPSTTPVGSKETGSITQGTPVHPYAVDKRGGPMYDYGRSIRHSPVTTSNVPVQPNSGVVVSHGQSSSQYSTYSMHNRQIIMNDFITSQQMQSRNRSGGSAEVTVKTEPPSTLYCASTPPPQPHTQARQGVIQRHNTQKHYAPPPPGLEAFSSLVDVAVQQPSLPVPHPPTSRGNDGLLDRMYPPDARFGATLDSRSLQNMPRLARQQYQMAVAMEQQQREREREFILREKQQDEEQRMQREKEQQQQQQLHHQHIERLHQREKEIQQQQQEHRLAAQHREQELQAAHAAAVQQREKEIHQQQQQQSHADHRLSIHQQPAIREKELQQHYRLVQQQQQHREKELQLAAQREKEHEHRIAAQQREKEIQQQELRLAQQKREKEIQQQQADQRFVAQQRDYLQHQQRYQKQIQQQMHQQHQHRMEAERRPIVQIYKDYDAQQLYREYAERVAERQCESPSVAKSGGFYQPSRIQQPPLPQQPQPSSRHGQSSAGQPGDSSTLTAASLIDAIITHQINQTAPTAGGAPPASNQPTRPGDRLFQSFHQDAPPEPNGMAHSPAGEENPANRESGSGSGSSGGNKALTVGEHIEHVVNKDYYRPYPGYQIPDDQWKRRKGSEPAETVKSGDERQIIRVAQQKQPSSQSHQSKQQQQQPSYHTEPVSPPEPTTNHYQRRFYEPSTATTTTPVTLSSKSQISPLDYVKNKIVEVMRTEDDKSSLGDRNGGSGGNDKDDKPDNSPSGEMVIDETPSQSQGQPAQGQPQQAPVPTPATFHYPYNALGVHTGPPPAPPPSGGGGTPVTVVKTEEPAPLLSSQYEPLSDED